MSENEIHYIVVATSDTLNILAAKEKMSENEIHYIVNRFLNV